MSTIDTFIHRFEPGDRLEAPPLLLLHGTGGDESDLLPLGHAVSPASALLSVRGRVLENGMPRFFRRFAEGAFDEEDLARQAHALADFVDAARKHYGIPAPLALGYSNGANIAAAIMLLRPQTLAGGVLLRAMTPFAKPPQADLSEKHVLILSGLKDPIVPAANSLCLTELLLRAGAQVERKVVPAGHALSQADLALTHQWLTELHTPVS